MTAVPALWRYGFIGLPLAFLALPLYVQWPAHYSVAHGLSLSMLGALLLAMRLLDAVVDPWIGRHADHWFDTAGRAWAVIGGACVAACAGFIALFQGPQGLGTAAALLWAAMALGLTHAGYSVAQIVHQAWGARLGGDAPARARVVAAREGAALVGVLLASALPAWLGLDVTAAVLAGLLIAAWWALRGAPRDAAVGGVVRTVSSGRLPDRPWRVPAFRWLMAVYVLNGLASAIPATLLVFFVRDRLQQPGLEGPALLAYFLAGAVSVPVWVRAVRRWGLMPTWAIGMGLALVTFAWAATLGPGDGAGFIAVCVASGTALGADLAVPGALLTGVVHRQGGQGVSEGRWFGWWAFATKLNLALAAGVALPLVQALGFAPGAREPEALRGLTLAYCVVPCVIKALALVVLWMARPQLGEDPSYPGPP